MKKVTENDSLQQIEQQEGKASTPDSMVREDDTAELLPTQNGWRCYWKRCMFLAMLVLCSVMLGIEINAQGTTIIGPDGIEVDDFNFLVYCPVSSLKLSDLTDEADSYSGNDDDLRRRRRLFQAYSNRIEVQENEKGNFDPSRTYLVQANSITYNVTQNGTIQQFTKLFYCGLVRNFYETCDKYFVACSTPGPMFDIPAREAVDIIWVNNLNESALPPYGNSCMNQTYLPSNNDAHFCYLMSKLNRTQTFVDPTGFTLSTPINHTVRIGPKAWPTTIHVHGAEVRPTFDGNPLSWTDNGDYTGHVGVGTFSMNDKCYYDQFDKFDNQAHIYNPPNIYLKDLNGIIQKNFKMNRYANLQNPGTLWYHDHAMRLTTYNVQYGLAGFYILRDEHVEEQIGVARENEKLVMISGLDLKTSFPLDGFETDTVYRFRFLNNYFGGPGSVWRISFSYKNCNDSISQREVFSIIGADSSLFSQSIDHQQTFVLTHAQRMELLIIFQKGQTNIAICGDSNITQITGPSDKPHPGHDDDSSANIQTDNTYSDQSFTPNVKKIGLRLIDRKQSSPYKNTRTTIDNVTLDVPYTDLSTVSETDIAVKRMRPLIFVGRQVFTINGRTDFHKGKSENPMLGTIEDWYLINTINIAHPIHVHLINFQVIKQIDLRVLTTPNNTACTLYELDFFVAALLNSSALQVQKYKNITFVNGVNASQGINYVQLCDSIRALGQLRSFYEALAEIFPEDHVEANKVSGLDLFPVITAEDQKNLQGLKINPPINFSDPNAFKYVPNTGAPPAKPYYSKWKDTAYVDVYKVLHYRIRWTKSNYTQADKLAGTYFHVPADQLREYPGYVYHCHILNHEDNEMMRPIMLQIPDNSPLGNTTCNYNLESKKKVLKWSDKYNCVNQQCGNQPT